MWLLMLVIALGACTSGNGGGGPEQAFGLDVAKLGEALYQQVAYRDQLEELDPLVVYTLLGVDGDMVFAQKNYFSSGATAEEIIIFQAKDDEALLALRRALEARLEDQAEIYASYAPEEVAYLKAAVLEEKGVYLVLCVSADAESAAKLVSEAFDEK